MATSQMTNVIQQMNEMLLSQETPDGQLLDDFVNRHDQAEAISVQVAALAEGVLKAMLLNKLKMVLAGLLALVVAVGIGAGSLLFRAQAADPTVAAPGVVQKEQKQNRDQEPRAEAPPQQRERKVTAKLAPVPNRDRPVDPATVAAWENGGGTYGRIETVNLGMTFRPGDGGGQIGLPSFCFPGGLPAGLPDAGVPIGLHMGYYAGNRPAVGFIPRNADAALPLTNETLKNFRGLKSVTKLSLYSFGLSDAGMSELTHLEGLTTLHLTVPVGVTDAGMKDLARLEKLTELSLSANLVTDAGLKDLSRLKNLSMLFLHTQKVTDAGLKDLKGLKNLNTLILLHTQGVTDAGMKDLADLQNLSSLCLGYVGVTDAGLKDLSGLKKLRTLNLVGTQVTGATLKDLAGLENLTTLDMTIAPVTDEGLKGLAPLKKLTSLSLFGTKVTDAGVRFLEPLENLEKLEIGNTELSDKGLKHLAALRKLSSLRLHSCRNLTDVGLKNLAPLDKLTSLDVSATAVSDEGVPALAALRNLTTLELSGTQMTDAGVARLRQLLPRCKIQR